MFLWFTKVKYVKSSSFSFSIKSTQSLFYRFNRNKLVHNKLQILLMNIAIIRKKRNFYPSKRGASR